MSTQHQHASNSNNLWIGELDHWMNEKYLSHALETYSNLLHTYIYIYI